MILVGTVANADDETSRIEAVDDDYVKALTKLNTLVPDGCRLISIRVTR
ncbi:hypothetical protein [Arthrobacter cryoconiti]|uniref:Uncharacterized protein n=1 Tax=Arthrobacter cryoconiti TaxID=748907 RepID=A0ABV8R480_9MICC|nr:hypothetical protein [Arthrobacter cryoconiti]MCC9069317.1 hypothetical protein [Arthrobacter cryoconiti]